MVKKFAESNQYHQIKMIVCLVLTCGVYPVLTGCNHNRGYTGDSENSLNKSIPVIEYTYIKSYPHDTASFTEGLLFRNSKLYESTGATKDLPQTRSLFGILNLTTGKIETKAEIDRSKYFGEGIAFLNGKIFQLTYKTKIGFIYDAGTFQKIGEFIFPGDEGWGMTTDGINLIMSDGTFELKFLDPITFNMVKKISVTENGHAKDNLNELEYINGYIFANIWNTNFIVKINPKDGKIVGKLNLDPLAYEANHIYPGSLEMNGIAYDSINDKIFITGKLWPVIYELQIDK